MLAITSTLVQLDDLGYLGLLSLEGFLCLAKHRFLFKGLHCCPQSLQLGVDFTLFAFDFHLFGLFDGLLDFLDGTFLALASLLVFSSCCFLLLFLFALAFFLLGAQALFLLLPRLLLLFFLA
jgi:hypothetical protein